VLDPAKQLARTAQIDRIYRAIGLFIVEFSHVVEQMEITIRLVVNGHKEGQIALLSELTAEPLKKAWVSVVIEVLKPDEADKKVLVQLAAEVTKLIEIRNDLAHGQWIIGAGNEQSTDWSTALFIKPKNSSSGVSWEREVIKRGTNAEVIEAQAFRAVVLSQAIMTYFGVYLPKAFPTPGIVIGHAADQIVVKHGVIYLRQNTGEWVGSDKTRLQERPN
jgi:hypothetical protein